LEENFFVMDVFVAKNYQKGKYFFKDLKEELGLLIFLGNIVEQK